MSQMSIKRMAFYAGIKKEEYDIVKDYINKSNSILLIRASFSASMILFFLTLASFVIPGLAPNKFLYLFTFTLTLFIYVVGKLFLKKKLEWTIILSYMFLSIVFLFAIILGVPLQPNNPATTVCVLIFALPLLIADRPLRMDIFLSVVTAVFCVFSLLSKPEEIAVLDATLKSNENTIATFRMNLTQNKCGEGSSRFDNLLNLQEDRTVDGFLRRRQIISREIWNERNMKNILTEKN